MKSGASGNLILLVEDSEDDVVSLTKALKRSGLRNPVEVVRDGAQALNYLTGKKQFAHREEFPLPKVMLLDLSLPRMSGWSVLKWVRSRAEFDATLVVV